MAKAALTPIATLPAFRSLECVCLGETHQAVRRVERAAL
jgi:hypothetical protein